MAAGPAGCAAHGVRGLGRAQDPHALVAAPATGHGLLGHGFAGGGSKGGSEGRFTDSSDGDGGDDFLIHAEIGEDHIAVAAAFVATVVAFGFGQRVGGRVGGQ